MLFLTPDNDFAGSEQVILWFSLLNERLKLALENLPTFVEMKELPWQFAVYDVLGGYECFSSSTCQVYAYFD